MATWLSLWMRDVWQVHETFHIIPGPWCSHTSTGLWLLGRFLAQPRCLCYADLCAGRRKAKLRSPQHLPPPPQGHADALLCQCSIQGGKTQVRDNSSFLSAIQPPPSVSICHPPSGLKTTGIRPAPHQFVAHIELLSLTLRGARPPAKTPY